MLKKPAVVAMLRLASVVPTRIVAAQVGGEATVGVAVEEVQLVVRAWSATQKLLGRAPGHPEREKGRRGRGGTPCLAS